MQNTFKIILNCCKDIHSFETDRLRALVTLLYSTYAWRCFDKEVTNSQYHSWRPHEVILQYYSQWRIYYKTSEAEASGPHPQPSQAVMCFVCDVRCIPMSVFCVYLRRGPHNISSFRVEKCRSVSDYSSFLPAAKTNYKSLNPGHAERR